jgi:hypothetical protein
MAYDLAGLRAESKFKLQNHDRFTDGDVDLAINRGIDQLVLFCSENYDVYNANAPLDPDGSGRLAMEFGLPSDTLYVKSVAWEGVPLKQLTQGEFISTRAEFGTAVGTPDRYYIRAVRWLNLFPRPESDTQTAQIYYLKKPADLVADDAVPALGREYSDALVAYTCYWLLRGQPEEETRSQMFLADYERERVRTKTNLHKNSIFKTRRVR